MRVMHHVCGMSEKLKGHVPNGPWTIPTLFTPLLVVHILVIYLSGFPTTTHCIPSTTHSIDQLWIDRISHVKLGLKIHIRYLDSTNKHGHQLFRPTEANFVKVFGEASCGQSRIRRGCHAGRETEEKVNCIQTLLSSTVFLSLYIYISLHLFDIHRARNARVETTTSPGTTVPPDTPTTSAPTKTTGWLCKEHSKLFYSLFIISSLFRTYLT